jgi:hypothetical protein
MADGDIRRSNGLVFTGHAIELSIAILYIYPVEQQKHPRLVMSLLQERNDRAKNCSPVECGHRFIGTANLELHIKRPIIFTLGTLS